MSTIHIRSRNWANKDGTRMVQYFLDFTDHNGKRRKLKAGGKPVAAQDINGHQKLKAQAMAEAQLIQQALSTAYQTGNVAKAQATEITVLQVVDQYLSEPREQTTKGRYMRRALARFRQSSKPLALWTEQDSEDFMRTLAAEYTHTTLPGYWRAFKRAMRFAVRSRMIDRDPTEGVEARGGRKTNPQENTLRDHEIKQLFSTPFREDIRGIAEWTLKTGMYYADFQKAFRSNMKQRADGSFELRWTRKKTSGASTCLVTADMLKHATGSADQLFPSMKLSQVSINKLLKQWAAAAGLERDGKPMQLSHVWLRRTFGNTARKCNQDPLIIQEMLGHTSQAPQRHYINADAHEVLAGSIKVHEALDALIP